MAKQAGVDPTSTTTTNKRQKVTENHHNDHHNSIDQRPLIPGLPDQMAQVCLSHVQPSLLYSVCHSWRKLIYSPSFPPFLSLYTILFPTGTRTNDRNDFCYNYYNTNSNVSSFVHVIKHDVHFFCYDPISSKWDPLPPPPPEDPPLRLLLRHPSFISRHLPVQSVSVAGRLVLLAATNHNFAPAFSRPLLFNPILAAWSHGPPLSAPRRWCVLGSSRSTVYVASGIGSQFSADVARSVEKWDLNHHSDNTNSENAVNVYNNSSFCRCGSSSSCCNSWKWEKMRGMKDGKFSRDAITAIGWRRKLCMVNVEGDAVKEGVIYDMERDEWLGMPEGMVAGWKGPAVAAEEEVMYVVDEARGVLRKYDEVRDDWIDVIVSDRLRGASHVDYGGGRICVVCGGGGGIVVVDVVAVPVRLVVVEVPVGFEAVAVHVLPRMCRPVFQELPACTSRT